MKYMLFLLMLAFCLTSVSYAATPPSPLSDADMALAAEDYATALRLYTPLAEQGNAPAQMRLGQIYEGGLGVTEDMSLAGQWYMKAAQQGHSGAQTSIGYFFEHGIGTKQNLAQAANWYSKAAQQGYARAQNNLGVMYLRGQGVTKNIKYGKELLQLAAQQGLPQAKDNLKRLTGDIPQEAKQNKEESIDVSPPKFLAGPLEQKGALTLTQGVRLFGIPLHHARREALREAIATWPAPKHESDNPQCDRYDASKIMQQADILEVCYTDDEFAQSVRYTFPLPQEHSPENLLKVVDIKNMVAQRHGPPQVVKGYRNKGPVYFEWGKTPIRISVDRQWPDVSVRLQYTVNVENGAQRQGVGLVY